MFRHHYAAFMVGCAAALAPAQDAMLEVRVLNDATPAEPEVQIEVWAHFPPTDYAWAATEVELFVAEPEFTRVDCPPIGCGMTGTMSPTRIEVLNGQVSFPPAIIADPTNPAIVRGGARAISRREPWS